MTAPPLALTIMEFARVLRRLCLPIGTDKVLFALDAVALMYAVRRMDLYWCLAAVLITRAEHRALFDAAFKLFWPEREGKPNSARNTTEKLPGTPCQSDAEAQTLAGQVTDAIAHEYGTENMPPTSARKARAMEFTFAADETLKRIDFEKMSAAEAAAVERLLTKLQLSLSPIATRRFVSATYGRRLDWRATLRAGLRSAGEFMTLKHHAPRRREPPIVVLCDISASMERYTRMFLLFLHALQKANQRVHGFVFGTRLTHITRGLAHRNVDVALAQVSASVADWAGGTRIGPCLQEFNRRWSRRVLAQNAVFLLVSDGLDRTESTTLADAMERLHKSCRRLVWLNPLLRYEDFEPKAVGVRAMLPHVDAFLPVHNLHSLEQLAQSLQLRGILNGKRPATKLGRASLIMHAGERLPIMLSSHMP